MKLENIECLDKEARVALDNLPDGVVDEEIEGWTDYTSMNNDLNPGSNVGGIVEIFVEKGLSRVKSPPNSSNYEANFTSVPSASFKYNGFGYCFIDMSGIL